MTKIDLINKLRSSFEFSIWKELFDVIFSPSCVQYFSQEVPVDTAFIKSGGHIGTIRLDDGRSLAIFIFEVADDIDISRNRKGLRDIAAKYVDQSLIHGALVLNYSKNQTDYRLTFIAKQSSFNESGQLIKTETAPKRYTFLLGPNESCTTAANRLYELFECKRKNGSIYLADVTEAFSVERLNKEFFDGYKKQYQKFLCNLSDTKQNRDYVKKLLGRIVFLHFLQKKGWMGVPASNNNWIGGDRNYLANLVAKYNGNNRLLSDVLELLFFNTLNQPRSNDLVDPILGNDIKIPYLNGGLFDKDTIDELDIDFPYDYFKDLMEFFSQYNFTIDENDPDYSEVGIDPEMLGHIFENLLEDNKDKGAFYTPKEIVQYMSRECIIQYLIAHTKEDLLLGQLKESIKDLVNKQVVSIDLQDKANAQRLYNLLAVVKVCDPAIGSGAFPMGVLNVLFHTRHVLHAFAFPKKDFVSTEVKREIIQNNIYGVDIEQGAIDIARLRFWLSLVVDAEKPHPLPNLDYKIVCGNSLLNRHALDVPIDDVFSYYSRKNKTDFTLVDYQQRVLEYTNTSDHKLKDSFKKTISDIKNAFKTSLTNRMMSKRNRIQGEILSLESDTLFGPPTKECLKRAKELRKKYARLLALNSDIENDKLYANAFEWRFEFPSLLDNDGNFKGFDIVIGNPPYLRIQGIRSVNSDYADELTEKYKSATGSFDLYALFVERGLQIINSTGIVNYIMPIKWTNSAFGKGLRCIISASQAACKFINFGAYQVFNASTYTALQWFMPNSNGLSYYELDRDLSTNQEIGVYLSSLLENNASIISHSKLNEKPWTLTVGKNAEIIRIIEQHTRRLGDVFDRIFCGLQTSKDDVYFIYDSVCNNDTISGLSKQLYRTVTIERGLVKPLLKGEDVHRYDNITTDRFVIFPYKLEYGKAILYTEEELATLFPKGYAYLKECEDTLREREKGRLMNDKFWYRYIYPKNLTLFANEKLVAPEISLGGNFAYDVYGEFYSTTKIYGYIKNDDIRESYKFWLGLLNSRLFWFYMQNTGYVLRGGYFTFKTNYVAPFPIPKFIPRDLVFIVETLVDYILFIKAEEHSISDLVSNKFISDYFERIIDGCIFELYFEKHINENSLNIVESAFNLIQPISFLNSSREKREKIWDVFTQIKKTDNQVRNRLELLANSEILKPIIFE